MNQIYYFVDGLSHRGKNSLSATIAAQKNFSLRRVGMAMLILSLFTSITTFAQTTYYSKATAVDFNDVNSWSDTADGTGVSPATISNADNFIITNNAALALSGNSTVRQLTINSGSLSIVSNTLTVSKTGTFDSSFVVNTGGTLNLSGGNLIVNGNVLFTSGSNFNQSGGILSVDGNNGGSATGSVAGGTNIFAIGTSGTTFSTGTVSLTGGKIIIVDPHTSTDTNYAFVTYLSSNALNITAAPAHTLQIGDGISTDAGGNAANGYHIYFWYSTGAFKSGNFIVNAPAGTNRHVTQQYRAIYGGDITVTTGELRLNSTNYTIAGNIFVDAGGVLTTTVPIIFGDGTYTGSTTITAAPALNSQTVSGTGIFRNATTAPTANFSSVAINNTSAAGVTFAGFSNIASQPANSVSVNGTLTFTAGKVGTTGNAQFILGISGTDSGTLSYSSGGFKSGTTFGRWYGATSTGTSFTAGSDATTATSRYPFVNSADQNRSAWIERVTPVGAAGLLGVTYNEVAGISTVNLTDGAFTADRKINDTWAVSSLAGTPTAAASFKVQFQAPGALAIPLVVANTRIVQGAAFVGAHQAGTVTPGGQRITLTAAELTAAPFSLVYSTAGVPIGTIASGNWNDPSIWTTGVVPSCTDAVYIAANTTVTVNSAAAASGALTIAANGAVVVASGDLTVGCTLNNTPFINNGTLTVSGGVLNVNGNMLHAAGSTFNHSAGDINVDGNSAGNAANSVASGTSIVQINTQNVNWTGGTLTIVDPHANSTASNAFAYNNSTAHVNVTAGHTIRFGNGTSTDAGGNATNGFRVAVNSGSNRISFNDFVINSGSGTNRFVSASSTFGINGNMTINANSEYRDAGVTTHIAGNLVNNGSYIATGTLSFNSYQNAVTAAITVAQTVTGTGSFSNLVASPTANLNSLTINNTSVSGVTFGGFSNISTQPANSVSVSGTLTFTAGKLNATGNAMFVLGTSVPATGTLTYTSGGFASGLTFGRWFTATGTGSSFTAGADATTGTSRYPFVNVSNQDRSAWIERVTPAAAAGIIGVTYNNTAGTSAINVTDTAPSNFTVDTKANDTWAVTAIQGTPLAAASFRLQLQAPGIFDYPLGVATTRIIQGSSFPGTHQTGTVTPGGQRILLTPAELTAAPFTLAILASDIAFVSVASGDWNSPTTWNKGAVPGCNDVIIIPTGFNVTVTSAANVGKTLTIATGASLTLASGDLTIGCTLNNNTFVNNGILTVAGGTLNVNGNMLHNAGSTFNQSGGSINVDGNDAGAAATSVASGVAIIQLNTNLVNWTGGTLTIVDPHANSTASNTLAYTVATNVNASGTHTIQFGNGISADAGGNATNAFRLSTFASSGRIAFNNFIVNSGSTGINRYITSAFSFGISGDLTISAGSEFRPAAIVYVAGNILNNGTYITSSSVNLANFQDGTSTAVTTAQTISGTGVFANNATTPTASFSSLNINNTSIAGVTLANPFSVSGTLTLTAGKVNTTDATMLTLGTATAAGTLTGGSATAYINGSFARTIATGNANTNFILFPVGKAVYAPIWLAPATTAVSVFKAETFDTNIGSMDPSVINLSTTRRWEAPLVSGAFTDIKVRLGDTGILTTSIPAHAPAAIGPYASSFGSLALYVAGTPNTTQAINAVTSTNYTGFLSFADSNSCMGVPAPGNTIASANNICAGTAVTLSVQSIPFGSGVTFQWQSSVDGIAYTDIASATSATYVTTPTASLYYQLKVTCATGPDTTTSVPVQVTFANSITATTPATRCGTGTVTLAANANAGANVRWYASPTGGTPLATGTTYSPTVSETTTYYAAPAVGGAQLFGGKLVPEATWTGSTFTNWGIVFTALQSTVLQSVDIYSTASGTIDIKVTNATGTELYSTGNISVTAGGTTTPTVIPLNFAVTAGTTYKVLVKSFTGVSLIRGETNLAFPYTNSDISVTSSEWGGTTTTTYYYFYNFKTESSCLGARIPVIASVTPAPALTLSTGTATICSGQSTAAVTITEGASDYDTYVWTPSAGVTGNAANGWTFNPTVATTYTLNASQSTGAMCAANAATVAVTVNPLPTPITIAPTGAACIDNIVTLTASGGTLSATGTVGTGTTTTTDIEELTAFSNRRISYKMQIIYTAAELQAAGLQAGNINSIAFNVITIGDAATNADYTVKMGTTANSNFPNTSYLSESAFTTVYGPATYTHAVGVNTVPFSTPFVWDGVSNIVISVSHLGADDLYNAETYYTNLGVNATLYNFNSLTATTGTLSTKRFNVTFTGNNPVTHTWSPATNLYTDAAATIPYVSGTNAATVYVKSATPVTTSYTATATSGAGCSVTASTTVTVNSTPAVTASDIALCNGSTVANLSPVATGDNLQWYNAATGGTALVATTVLASGTYYVSQTQNGCESPRASFVVTINTTAAPTASDLTFCNASPTVANLTATGTSLQWYSAATGGTALATTTALVSGTYYVSQTVNGCESARTAVAVTVNTTAAPTASNMTFCNASPTVANLTATGTALQWYAAVTGGTALADATALTTGTTYYVSQTINGCESARTAVLVTINTTLAPTASALAFCNASPTVANLTATGAGLQWYDAATGGTALATATAVVSGTYYVSQTVNGCESPRTAVAVTVNTTAVPTASDFTFCNEAPTVANLTATGTNLQWYNVATGGTALATTTSLVSGNYYVSQTVNGCESARTEVEVTLNTTAAPVASDMSFCNEAPTVADLVATGTALQWYAAETGGTALADATALTNGSTYYVSQTINGCEGPRAGVTVTLATAVADEIADQVVCGSYTLPVLTNGNYFTATNGGGTPLAAGAEIFTNSEIFIFTQNGTCTAETSFAITVNTAGDITGDAVQQIEVQDLEDATIEDLVVTAAGTVIWYATSEDAVAGINPLAAGTQLVNNEDYFAVQTVGDCTSAPFEVTVTVSLGREDFAIDNIKYYPNPVVEKLTVSFSSNITQVEVYNLLGQLVIAQQPNTATTEVNMSRLEAATYIVKVTAEGKSKTFKVIKN